MLVLYLLFIVIYQVKGEGKNKNIVLKPGNPVPHSERLHRMIAKYVFQRADTIDGSSVVKFLLGENPTREDELDDIPVLDKGNVKKILDIARNKEDDYIEQLMHSFLAMTGTLFNPNEGWKGRIGRRYGNKKLKFPKINVKPVFRQQGGENSGNNEGGGRPGTNKGGNLRGVLDTIKDKLGKAKDKIGGALGKVKDKVGGMLGKVKDKFGNAISKFKPTTVNPNFISHMHAVNHSTLQIAKDLMLQTVYQTRYNLRRMKAYRKKFAEEAGFKVAELFGAAKEQVTKIRQLYQTCYNMNNDKTKKYRFLAYLVVYEKALAANIDITYMVQRMYAVQKTFVENREREEKKLRQKEMEESDANQDGPDDGPKTGRRHAFLKDSLSNVDTLGQLLNTPGRRSGLDKPTELERNPQKRKDLFDDNSDPIELKPLKKSSDSGRVPLPKRTPKRKPYRLSRTDNFARIPLRRAPLPISPRIIPSDSFDELSSYKKSRGVALLPSEPNRRDERDGLSDLHMPYRRSGNESPESRKVPLPDDKTKLSESPTSDKLTGLDELGSPIDTRRRFEHRGANNIKNSRAPLPVESAKSGNPNELNTSGMPSNGSFNQLKSQKYSKPENSLEQGKAFLLGKNSQLFASAESDNLTESGENPSNGIISRQSSGKRNGPDGSINIRKVPLPDDFEASEPLKENPWSSYRRGKFNGPIDSGRAPLPSDDKKFVPLDNLNASVPLKRSFSRKRKPVESEQAHTPSDIAAFAEYSSPIAPIFVKKKKYNRLSKFDGFPKSYAITKSNGIQKSDHLIKFDHVSSSNVISKSNGVTNSDAIPESDTVSKSDGIQKSDAIERSHGVPKSGAIVKSDRISKSDMTPKSVQIPKSDTIPESGTNTKYDGIPNADAVANSDEIRKFNVLPKSDSIPKADAAQSDQISKSDRIPKSNGNKKSNEDSQSDRIPKSEGIKTIIV